MALMKPEPLRISAKHLQSGRAKLSLYVQRGHKLSTVGLSDLKDLFQRKWFYDSVKHYEGCQEI